MPRKAKRYSTGSDPRGLGAGEVEIPGFDPEPGEVLGNRKAGAAVHRRLVDDDLVDRAAAALGADVGLERDQLGREDELALDGALARHLAVVLGDGLGRDGLVGEDEQRAGQGLRAAPALGDRGLGEFGLLLAVVDQQPHGEEREGEQEADQKREAELGGRAAVGARAEAG